MPLDASHVGWLLTAGVAYLMLRAILSVLFTNMQRRLDVYNLALRSRQMRMSYLNQLHEKHELETAEHRRKEDRHTYYLKHGVYPPDAEPDPSDIRGNSSIIIEDDDESVEAQPATARAA
jgi:hypothetical protein